MLHFRPTRQFDKDMKTVSKRHLNIDLLEEVVQRLAGGQKLPDRYRDHLLVGKYRGDRECHIQPDWLFVYHIEGQDLIGTRTGSHADLF
ncbi:MAG: type II toxin-antitoxin system YafQ family toxin [Propionibacteriaceae bacterium]|nr:type II toxin-antitoxin system YafQ family toxin [Propionibacteriaceae bacterium]